MITEGAIREIVGGTNAGLTNKALRSLFEEGAVERTGGGKKGDPYLYRLAHERELIDPRYLPDDLYIPAGATDAEVEALCGTN